MTHDRASLAEEGARRVREVLDRAGYSDRPIAEALGVEDIPALDRLPAHGLARRLGEHGGGHRQYVARDCGGHEWIFAEPLP